MLRLAVLLALVALGSSLSIRQPAEEESQRFVIPDCQPFLSAMAQIGKVCRLESLLTLGNLPPLDPGMCPEDDEDCLRRRMGRSLHRAADDMESSASGSGSGGGSGGSGSGDPASGSGGDDDGSGSGEPVPGAYILCKTRGEIYRTVCEPVPPTAATDITDFSPTQPTPPPTPMETLPPLTPTSEVVHPMLPSTRTPVTTPKEEVTKVTTPKVGAGTPTKSQGTTDQTVPETDAPKETTGVLPSLPNGPRGPEPSKAPTPKLPPVRVITDPQEGNGEDDEEEGASEGNDQLVAVVGIGVGAFVGCVVLAVIATILVIRYKQNKASYDAEVESQRSASSGSNSSSNSQTPLQKKHFYV